MTPDQRIRSPVMAQAQIPSALAALAAPPLRLDTTSLKVPRPHMLAKLYSDKPDQCRQCGRRFAATEDGKKKKAAHLDWHFKTASMIADASNGIINRLPYLDELDWIHFRELDALNNPSGAGRLAGVGGGGGANNAAKNRAMRDAIPVPKEGSGVNTLCPICQDKFETAWNEELQTMMWINVVKAGGKVYHKKCLDEVKGAAGMSGTRGSTPVRNTPTPDSVAGKKRKIGET
jgi:pre-mRNA cleavage complex 2 protein Pcf11